MPPQQPRRDDAHVANSYWERQADRAYEKMGGPTEIRLPRSSLWICSEFDITQKFLWTVHSNTMIVTCKDAAVVSVQKAARACGLPEPVLMNISYFRARQQYLFDVIGDVTYTLNQGIDALYRCILACPMAYVATSMINLRNLCRALPEWVVLESQDDAASSRWRTRDAVIEARGAPKVRRQTRRFSDTP